MRNRATVFGLGAGLLLTLSAVALAATLNVKPGLWEITSEGQASGLPPIPPQVLAQMSPQQRAQLMAAMAQAMGRANQPMVTRSCVTRKMLDRGWNPNPNGRDNCLQTLTRSTSTSLDAHMECTGQQKATGNLHIDALDSETMRGAFDMAMGDGTNSMTMKRTMTGKWLGSDCGSVRPNEE